MKRWAYCVTTVPSRFSDLLPRTLRSLEAGGFPRPRLHIDGAILPGDKIPPFDHSVTVHSPALGCYGNWYLALAETYVRDPACDYYAIFQDDFVCSRNLRQYLEANPCPQPGYMNLHSFGALFRGEHLGMSEAEALKVPPGSWTEGPPADRNRNGVKYHGKDLQKGWGATALVFTREGVWELLSSKHMARKHSDPQRGKRWVDGGVVECMNQAGFREYVHNPSLILHTGEVSTIGGSHYPSASTFRGEAFDLMSLLQG